MPEGTPTTVQIVIYVLVALGARELLAVGYKHWLSRSRNNAEIGGLRLSNTKQEIETIEESMDLLRTMRTEMEADKKIIAALKDDKIEDDRKIARRDGVIEEQRKELRELHEQMAELQVKYRELELRVDAMERENKELLKENYQLKGMEENVGKNHDRGE